MEGSCYYGCGGIAVYHVGKQQRPCCSQHYTQCPGFQRRRRITVEARGGFGFQRPETRAKAQARILEVYGVDNVGRLEGTKAKIRATVRANLGVDNPFAAPEVIRRIRETMTLRYGAPNPSQVPEFVAKRQNTFDERFQGNPQRDPGVKEKTRITNAMRYGGPAPLCDHSLMSKARSKWCRSGVRLRPFILPSGRTVMVQGYETMALALLIEEGCPEDDIRVGSEVPAVTYWDTVNFRPAKQRTYHPDIYIPSQNLLLEVKSIWTFQRGKCPDGLGIDNPTYELNMIKAQAARAAGFQFQFMLKHNDGHWSRF